MHFGHKNIITYCNRPFLSTDEMDQTIINNWNLVVGLDDLVYVVGDITMGFSKARMKAIFESLNGTKILIRGNHDKGHIPYACFENVTDRIHIIGDDYNFILIHDPSEASANHLDDQKYLCGHLHSNAHDRVYRNWIDVGVDANNYTPISLDECIKIFKDEAEKKLNVNELLQPGTPDCN